MTVPGATISNGLFIDGLTENSLFGRGRCDRESKKAARSHL